MAEVVSQLEGQGQQQWTFLGMTAEYSVLK